MRNQNLQAWFSWSCYCLTAERQTGRPDPPIRFIHLFLPTSSPFSGSRAFGNLLLCLQPTAAMAEDLGSVKVVLLDIGKEQFIMPIPFCLSLRSSPLFLLRMSASMSFPLSPQLGGVYAGIQIFPAREATRTCITCQMRLFSTQCPLPFASPIEDRFVERGRVVGCVMREKRVYP